VKWKLLLGKETSLSLFLLKCDGTAYPPSQSSLLLGQNVSSTESPSCPPIASLLKSRADMRAEKRATQAPLFFLVPSREVAPTFFPPVELRTRGKDWFQVLPLSPVLCPWGPVDKVITRAAPGFFLFLPLPLLLMQRECSRKSGPTLFLFFWSSTSNHDLMCLREITLSPPFCCWSILSEANHIKAW